MMYLKLTILFAYFIIASPVFGNFLPYCQGSDFFVYRDGPKDLYVIKVSDGISRPKKFYPYSIQKESYEGFNCDNDQIIIYNRNHFSFFDVDSGERVKTFPIFEINNIYYTSKQAVYDIRNIDRVVEMAIEFKNRRKIFKETKGIINTEGVKSLLDGVDFVENPPKTFRIPLQFTDDSYDYALMVEITGKIVIYGDGAMSKEQPLKIHMIQIDKAGKLIKKVFLKNDELAVSLGC